MRASRGEIKIEEILRDANLNFRMEYSFDGLASENGRPLRFDFVIFDDDGYVAIEVTSVEDLCVHPKWSGTDDTIYKEYVEPDTIEFPTHAAPPDPDYPDIPGPELPLHIYGIPRVGSVPDTLDLDAGIYF